MHINKIIEFKNKRDEIIRAAVVEGDTWAYNKDVPNGTDDPLVKQNL